MTWRYSEIGLKSDLAASLSDQYIIDDENMVRVSPMRMRASRSFRSCPSLSFSTPLGMFLRWLVCIQVQCMYEHKVVFHSHII